MPRLRLSTIPALRADHDTEADLLAEVRIRGLRLKYDSTARRLGEPHVFLRRREGRVLGSFHSAGAALAWLNSQEIGE